jgi:RimJ/RimL family protein N-acetyltransferase
VTQVAGLPTRTRTDNDAGGPRGLGGASGVGGAGHSATGPSHPTGVGPSLTPVRLDGRHVGLEPLRMEHAHELWLVQDERTWDFMIPSGVRTPFDLKVWMQARLDAQAQGTALPFLLRDASGKAAGSSSLFDYDRHGRKVEIGHTWVAPHARRSGLNTEAKLILMRHAFNVLGVNRLQLKTDLRNHRSQKAIERLGAQREGVLRSWITLPDGHLRDTVMYSIVRAEWPAVEARLVDLLAQHA